MRTINTLILALSASLLRADYTVEINDRAGIIAVLTGGATRGWRVNYDAYQYALQNSCAGGWMVFSKASSSCSKSECKDSGTSGTCTYVVADRDGVMCLFIFEEWFRVKAVDDYDPARPLTTKEVELEQYPGTKENGIHKILLSLKTGPGAPGQTGTSEHPKDPRKSSTPFDQPALPPSQRSTLDSLRKAHPSVP